MNNKLLSKKGETLLESLVAILIFTFASIAMFSSVMTANGINRSAREVSSQIEGELNQVEKADQTPMIGSVSIKYRHGGPSGASVEKIAESDVYIFGDPSTGELYSYFEKD